MSLFNDFNPPGKQDWADVLRYTAALHDRSVHPAQGPLPYNWEEIGPGYCYAPAFGHWDIIHQIMDVIDDEPLHAKHQFINNLHNMTDDGFLPGSIWFDGNKDEGDPDKYQWSDSVTHPPVWPVACEALLEKEWDQELFENAYAKLIRQINWWEINRKAEGEGYYYTDISTKQWESGVDEGIRFDDVLTGKWACIDATCHVYLLYEYAVNWAQRLNKESDGFSKQVERIAHFVRTELWCDETGFFHDLWAQRNNKFRCFAQEGMWPIIVGIASAEQAQRVINENLLNPERFYTAHPLATVAKSDARFEQRMWRGPAWNSLTWWAARGCIRYGRHDGAIQLLESALDATAQQFARTGVIWEFYHSELGEQTDVQRKPQSYNEPCKDYLGHNPLIAMARMWEASVKEVSVKAASV